MLPTVVKHGPKLKRCKPNNNAFTFHLRCFTSACFTVLPVHTVLIYQ